MTYRLNIVRIYARNMHTTAPLADSSINDRLVKLCPFVYQTCFEFLEVSYPEVVNLLL